MIAERHIGRLIAPSATRLRQLRRPLLSLPCRL